MLYSLPRKYKNLAPDYAELIPVDEWEAGRSVDLYGSDTGSAFWVRNGMQSSDSAYDSDKNDATHVAWYETPSLTTKT